MKLPEIKDFAAKLIHTCFCLIATYAVFTLLYVRLSNDAMRHVIGSEMLESAALATVLALGGGFLLDFEIRLYENKNTP